MHQVARAVLAGLVPNEYVHQTCQWDTSSAQDYVVLGQGSVADREHEHLGKEDVGIILLRKIWVRELRALAEGRPAQRLAVGTRTDPARTRQKRRQRVIGGGEDRGRVPVRS